MIVLSFDVGIRNLAYCLLEIDMSKLPNNSNDVHKITDTCDYLYAMRILDWAIINLVNDDVNVMCEGMNKKGNCKSKASFKKNNVYYCKRHGEASKYMLPHKDLNEKQIKKLTKEVLIQICNENSIDSANVTKKIEYISLLHKFMEENVLECVRKERTSEIGLVSLGKNMTTQFDTLFSTYNIDTVLIENQISPIANRMKTLQGMIAQYFIMKQVPTIEFVSSSNKLKLFTTKKTNYNERKKLSIDIMNESILDKLENNKWSEFFNKHKKKDDLADSFLQSLHYVVTSKHI